MKRQENHELRETIRMMKNMRAPWDRDNDNQPCERCAFLMRRDASNGYCILRDACIRRTVTGTKYRYFR